MTEYAYAVVQFVPDPMRDERINVGIVVVSPSDDFFSGRMATSRDLGRLRRLGVAFETGPFQDLARSFQRSARSPEQLGIDGPWSYEALRQASVEWGGTLQLTPVRPVLHDQPDLLLTELYGRLVADPAPRRGRARDRRWVNRRVRERLRGALADHLPGVDPDEHIQRNVDVAGQVASHRFDFELVNGRPLQLVRTVSFEGADDQALRNEVDAIAWAIEDVHRAHDELPCAVVSIGSSALAERASRACAAYGAELVREGEMDAWLATAAAHLVLAVGAPAT